ncbi:nuclear transport factor 2 family protein [Sphingobium sp. EM0848]|uniref:nuclear transport factor 2 family protein n=1 Tax=Sphingobium sp. EM0848 TaxID=2743473 RepID=UPI00159BF75C|nr:nuclear transport factor 2 family protein [Sphingobium sp. EM0848]
MAYSLQQLSDMEDIRTLKHRYFRGIDTADMALLATLFTDDVSVEYRGGGYKVKLAGRDNMMDFLANSFHSGTAAMHHGHMPEITLTGADEAEGLWYLEDIFINVEDQLHTSGTAIYRDHYRREDGAWRIARTEYDRVIEIVLPLDPQTRITAHRLGTVGRKPHERTDISHFIQWDNG